MKTRSRKFGSQEERRKRSREKLLDAAIGLVAARGFHNVTLAEVERQAGLNRRLAAHHFGSLPALLSAAMERALDVCPPAPEPGLQSLRRWLSERVAAVAAQDAASLATLWLATAAGLPVELLPARERYWRSRAQFVEANLARALLLGEVREGLQPEEMGTILLGQLHGELLRISTTQAQSSQAFLDLIMSELSATPSATTPRKRKVPAPSFGQRELFD